MHTVSAVTQRPAAHIDLPLDLPDDTGRKLYPHVRAMPFIDKQTVDAVQALWLHNERQRDVELAWKTEGFQRGKTVGYWQGAKVFGWVGWAVGMVMGVLIAALGYLAQR